MKLTQSNKNYFFKNVTVGAVCVYSGVFSLEEVKELAQADGVTIKYDSSYDRSGRGFQIIDVALPISFFEPADNTICKGVSKYCGKPADAVSIGNSKGFIDLCANCSRKLGVYLVETAFDTILSSKS